MLVPQLKIETSKKNQHINSNNILAGLQKNNCAKKKLFSIQLYVIRNSFKNIINCAKLALHYQLLFFIILYSVS